MSRAYFTGTLIETWEGHKRVVPMRRNWRKTGGNKGRKGSRNPAVNFRGQRHLMAIKTTQNTGKSIGISHRIADSDARIGNLARNLVSRRIFQQPVRAMARTNLDEVLGFRRDFIEQKLADTVRDPNGRVHKRSEFFPERQRMMQEWADSLDRLRGGEEPKVNQTAS